MSVFQRSVLNKSIDSNSYEKEFTNSTDGSMFKSLTCSQLNSYDIFSNSHNVKYNSNHRDKNFY